MSPRSHRKSQDSARQLIDSMTDSEALPAFVPRIDPRTLKHLVDEVGLEDAGALVVQASSQQIAHLLDESIWWGARPGDPERLNQATRAHWRSFLMT